MNVRKLRAPCIQDWAHQSPKVVDVAVAAGRYQLGTPRGLLLFVPETGNKEADVLAPTLTVFGQPPGN